MNTPKTTTTKLLRRIDAELDSFVHPSNRVRYARWLRDELNAMQAKLLPIASAGAADEMSGNGASPGGAGVAADPAGSKSDWLQPPDKKMQCSEEPQQEPGETESRYEAMGADGKMHPLTETTWARSVFFDQAKAKEIRKDGEIHVDEHGTRVFVPNLESGNQYNTSLRIAPPEPKEPPRWPDVALVYVLGPVPNPSMFAAELEDGRRVSLLKAHSRVEYKKRQAVLSRWSTRGTVGNPIYEVAP